MCNIIKAISEKDLIECSNIRRSVFGDEENAAESLYVIDTVDRLPETKNFLLKHDNRIIGTARYTKYNEYTAKLQRMAVLKEYRGSGFARRLLNAMENELINEGYTDITLDSARSAKVFYEKNGYEVISPVFYEDDRPHVKMQKSLKES